MISCLLLLLMLCIRRCPLVLGTTRPCCRSARVPQGLEGRQRRFAFSFNICLFAFFFFLFSRLVLVVAVSDPPAEGGGINSRPPALFVTGCYYIEYNRPRLAPHEYAKKSAWCLSRVLRWVTHGVVVFPVRSGRLVRPGHMLTYLCMYPATVLTLACARM